MVLKLGLDHDASIQTKKEVQVLLRRRGQVLSRELLLQEVWQGERSSSNVVEVYVRYLRQKLEAGGERRLLHTVRGRGYCLGQVLPEA